MANEFLELIRKSDQGKYCTKLFCTTCGAMKFREELKKIGYMKVIDDMYSLKIEDIRGFETWMDCVNLARFDMKYELSNIPYVNRPLILNHVERAVNDIIKLQVQRKINEEEELDLLSKQRLKKKLQEQINYRNNRIISNEIRMEIMSRFNKLDIGGKLNMIATDYEHLPSYYPLDLFSISTKTLMDLDKSVLNKLIMRFSVVNKKEWKLFYLRLLNLFEV